MLTIVFSVLALAGAPANTSVNCVPSFAPGVNALGLSGYTEINLRGEVCLGLLWLGASERERTGLAHSNPGVNWPKTVGTAALVALHEASHVALQNLSDECLVEAHAAPLLPKLLSRWPSALREAQALDVGYRSAQGC